MTNLIYSVFLCTQSNTLDIQHIAFKSIKKSRSITELKTHFQNYQADILFIELSLISSEENSNDMFQELWELKPFIEIVLLVEHDKIRHAIPFIKQGAANYLPLPVEPSELTIVLELLEEQHRLKSELEFFRERSIQVHPENETYSQEMRTVYKHVDTVAKTNSTILLSGETGTGKTLLAKLIHKKSKRASGPFINVHCGAIPENLLESDLFGHEKGAFTGAIRQKKGKFEIANGGTLFLDEIGTISSAMQIKLLKVLQEKSFCRVGGEDELHTDVRIIAASNEDLKSRCERGDFRWDLYYRLNVFPLYVPALRERKEDIPLLITSFLKRISSDKTIAPKAINVLQRYEWPGNIRELENVVERAVIISESNYITTESLPKELIYTAELAKSAHYSLHQFKEIEHLKMEKYYLINLLEKHQGKIKQTAEEAQITTRYLNLLMTKHQLKKEYFKTRTHGSQ